MATVVVLFACRPITAAELMRQTDVGRAAGLMRQTDIGRAYEQYGTAGAISTPQLSFPQRMPRPMTSPWQYRTPRPMAPPLYPPLHPMARPALHPMARPALHYPPHWLALPVPLPMMHPLAQPMSHPARYQPGYRSW